MKRKLVYEVDDLLTCQDDGEALCGGFHGLLNGIVFIICYVFLVSHIFFHAFFLLYFSKE